MLRNFSPLPTRYCFAKLGNWFVAKCERLIPTLNFQKLPRSKECKSRNIIMDQTSILSFSQLHRTALYNFVLPSPNIERDDYLKASILAVQDARPKLNCLENLLPRSWRLIFSMDIFKTVNLFCREELPLSQFVIQTQSHSSCNTICLR